MDVVTDKPIFDFTPPPEPAPAPDPKEEPPPAEPPATESKTEPPPAGPSKTVEPPPKVDTVPFNKFEREKQRRREAEEKARNLALEAERYKGMVEGMKKPEPPKEAPEPEAKQPPKLDDYPDWDSYDTAKTEWIAEQKLAAYQTQVREKLEREASEKAEAARKQAEIESHQRYVRTVQEKVRAAGAANPDYAAAVQGEAAAHFSDAVLKMMVDSDKFQDMTYYLASNVDKLDRLVMLANANPIAAAVEVGNLEAAFKYGPPVKKTSTAPPPVAPLTPAPSKADHEESAEEYIRRRNREDAERRSARRK